MDVTKMGAELLSGVLGDSVDSSQLEGALSSLLGGGDISALTAKMAGSVDLSAVLGSWLGDGANAGISAETITSFFGNADIASFASQLGIDPSTAATSLAEVVPQLMDKASSGGNLLDSMGGAEGLLGAAKSFLS